MEGGHLIIVRENLTSWANFWPWECLVPPNKFKLKYKPQVYEYIGELDLIVNKPFHQLLWSTNKIQKEFYKPALKK